MKTILLTTISLYLLTNSIILIILLKKEFHQIKKYELSFWTVLILAIRVLILGIPLLIAEQVK